VSDEKKILRAVQQSEGGKWADYVFWCPGCKEGHGVWTTKQNGMGAIWTFNGNLERPTFTPSLLLRYTVNPPVDPATNDFKRGADGKYLTRADGKLLGCRDMVCHSYIRDGQIQFLSDCTHELANKTVPMEAF